ncbi:hypothetical protein [Micrococcus sp. FDAARGOS_333]|uniref:hypothetical protein n=1 Tax=Micrococcus sp. FDAARGOS_333 TaxID=1930558 RepID=UPI000B4DFD86|nr:hypothetical protein [Micrococcus sp. FDAARGOS_333]PNL18423.1 hypothetical protein CEQ11_010345 [Micrococcus sp. FDAARGOS_333]
MDEINTLAAELNAVLGVFSDLRVSASLVILALILWLGWNVVTAERRRADAREAHAAEAAASPAADAAVDSASTTSPQEGTPMTSASAPAPKRRTFRLPAVRRPSFDTRRAAPAGGFRVRWGRTALFLAAVALAVTFLVTGVAAAFGAETVTVAGWSLLGALAAVATLRVLAVRERKARRAARAARAEAHRAPAHIARGVHVARSAGRTAEPAVERTGTAAPVAAAPAEKAAPSVDVRPAAAQAAQTEASVAEQALPVRVEEAQKPRTVVLPTVPRPTYLDAPEMQRSAPARIETAEKVPSGDVRLAEGVSELQRRRLRDQATPALDLDSVLARRRAS